MTTTVGAHDAQTHLADYLNRAAYGGERIVVERHGKPVAALVSIDDLQRLEQLEGRPSPDRGAAAKQAQFRQAMGEAGLTVQWPTGEPVAREAYRPLEIDGPPLSEQVIADRR